MSILKKLSNIFRARKDQLEDAMTDVVRDAKFDIEDARKEVSRFKTQVASLMAENKRQERSLKDAKSEVKKWLDIAKKAAANGNESDVTSAVDQKQQAEARVKSLQDIVNRNSTTISGLRAQLQKTQDKIAYADSNFAQLKARKHSADVRKSLMRASAGLEGSSALSRLNQLEDSVVAAETEVEALDDLNTDGSADLLEKYSGKSESVSDEVAKLMANAKEK